MEMCMAVWAGLEWNSWEGTFWRCKLLIHGKKPCPEDCAVTATLF